MFEIGSSLQEARLRQGVDLNEAEAATKIRAKYLRALEDERFEILPAQTYVKGFLRAYADYLGLDGQLYVDEFNSRYVPGDDELAALRVRRSPATSAAATAIMASAATRTPDSTRRCARDVAGLRRTRSAASSSSPGT